MTDEEAIMIARRSSYGASEVKIPDYSYDKPHAIIVVNLATTPPTVTRIDDEHPRLRADT